MKYEEFTDEMRNDIVNATRDSLAKLGIHVNVDISAKTTRRNNEYITIKTDTFQTTPVIYKSVFVYGSGWVVQTENAENVFDLNIELNYGFEYFNGGSNGVEIGELKFRIFKDTMTVYFRGFKI